MNLFYLVTSSIVFIFCSLVPFLQAQLQNGTPCDPKTFQWSPVENNPDKFFYCDILSAKVKTSSCPEMNEIKLYFNEKEKRCVGPRQRNKRAIGTPKSSNVGEACSFNTDCKDNMFCPSGTCQCNPGFVGAVGAAACLATINPGQQGCSQDIQCSTGWPGSTCASGICQCPDPTNYFLAQTQDGFVCHRLNACPFPDDTTKAVVSGFDQLNGGTCVYLTNDDGTITGSDPRNYCHTTANNNYQGDMYDCIPSTSAVTQGTAGICCPTRALTCILPKMASTATTAPLQTRYWYNSITGGCEPFAFNTDDNQGNANAFLTLQFCLSYCGGACRHGPPNLGTLTTTTANRVTTCISNANCPSITPIGQTISYSYVCSQTGSTRTCCAPTSLICTAYGGRQVYGQPNGPNVPNPSAPDTGSASNQALPPNLALRWYYDTTTQTCISFTYQGNTGNWNNFLSQSDCMQFCISAVCDQGAPLKTATGTNQVCSGSTGCPSTYSCKSNLCCPTKQTVCIQPKSPGTCTGTIPAYWFNAATSDCESFTYTGCSGNDNNFASYSACISYCGQIRGEPRCMQGEADKDSTGKYLTCTSSGSISTCRTNYECYYDGTLFGCCPSQSWTCQLQRSVGSTCITAGARWYYDTTLRACQPFTYNGCDGNSNNFVNKDDCDRYCGAGGCPYGGSAALTPNTNTRAPCSAATPCSTGYECQSITISGSVQSACCYSRIAICQMNPVQGSTTTGTPLTRYYFNPSTRSCATFTFFGSGGNLNNFATLSQCTNFCSSSACALGDTVALVLNTQTVQTCTQQQPSTCPTGYQCRQDTLFSRFVCCGSTDMVSGVCPTGEKAFIDAYTQAPRECRQGVVGDCYTNYLCRPNTVRNRNYCCAPAAGTYCLAGYGVYRDSVTLQPQSCFVSTVNSCNSGYTCQSTSGQVQGFCCTINPLCPNNGNFATDANQNPVACTISTTATTNPCSTGFTCQTTTAGSTSGYCCSTGTTTTPCGTLTPVIDPSTNAARICSNTVTCPSGSCTLNTQSGVSYCCLQSTGTDPDGCGVGLIAYRETTTSVIRQCVIGPGSNCPPGFGCQATTLGQNRCCGLSAGCPTNSAALINPSTGGIQTCTQGGTTCTTGFSCALTSSGSVCCSNGQAISANVCPAGQAMSQTCSDTIPCPTNFECIPTSQGLTCCPARANVCTLPMQAGTTCATATAQTRFYFDSTQGLCTQFTYNGCGGNDNSFASFQACDLYCAQGICPRGQPARNGNSLQLCSGGAGCSAGFQCTSPRYGLANSQLCCISVANSCALTADPGVSCGSTTTTGINRYAYNSASRTCSQFVYLGCGGNGNNFASLAECQAACQTTTTTGGCPLTTQQPYVAPGTTVTQRCNPGGCPAGYICANNGNSFVCCSARNDMCPAGSLILINPATGALDCMAQPCTTGSRCTYSATYRRYFCCTTGGTITPTVAPSAGCPNNLPAFYTTGSGTPASCTPGATGIGACPATYACLMSTTYRTTICCRQTALTSGNSGTGAAGCPNNQPAYFTPSATTPATCKPGVASGIGACPTSYTCAMSSTYGTTICCLQSSSSVGNSMATRTGSSSCPSGGASINYPGTNLPLACSGPDDTRCPSGYCASVNGSFQCCTTG